MSHTLTQEQQSDSMADELRAKGNAAFTAKNFTEAIRFYDEAIAVDPKMVELYNNRSAANFELKRFDDAIEDAKRGLKVSSSSKGHMRLGNAYWAQGRLELARSSYELALSAAPSNQTIRDNLTQLRQLIAAKNGASQEHGAFTGGESATQDMLALYADAAVLLCAVVHFVGMFLSASVSLMAWRLCFGAFAVRQLLILRASHLLQPNLETLKKWPAHFSAQYFVLAALGFVLNVPPLHLLLAAMSMYCVVDLAANGNALQNKVPPPLQSRVAGALQQAKANRDVLIGNAATCEAMLVFMLLFSGASVIFNVLYVQFIKYRYRSDPFCRLAFSALRQTVERLTRHRLCPPAVDKLFSKFCDLLYRVGNA